MNAVYALLAQKIVVYMFEKNQNPFTKAKANQDPLVALARGSAQNLALALKYSK